MSSTQSSLVITLPDEWWEAVTDADRFKPIFKCVKQLVEVMTGDDTGNRPFPHTINHHHLNSKKLMKILINWLQGTYIVIKVYILKLLPTLIRSCPTKLIQSYSCELIDIIRDRLWRENRLGIGTLCNTVLLELWIKTQDTILNDLIQYLWYCSERVLDLITKCSYFKGDVQCKQLNDCLDERGRWGNVVLDKLVGLALEAKNKNIRMAGCICFYTMVQNEVDNENVVNKWKQIEETKRMKQNVESAKKQYESIQNMLNSEQLIYGFVRNAVNINIVPDDILKLLINWYTDFHFTLNRLNEFEKQ